MHKIAHQRSFLQDVQILVVRDKAAAHAAEMRRLKLTVDQSAAIRRHILCECDERHLTAVGHQREHALAEKAAANVDAIDAVHQELALPHLNAGSKALTVQLLISVYHVAAQPGTLLVVTQFATKTDNVMKVAVYAHAISSLSHQFAH